MVKIGNYEVCEGLYYNKEQSWVRIEGDSARFGITDYGQKAFGEEFDFVGLPSVGDSVKQNEPYGELEAVKNVVDLIAPLSGTVKEVNEELQENPTLINRDPYGKGWILLMTPSNLKEELVNILPFEAAVEWYKEFAQDG